MGNCAVEHVFPIQATQAERKSMSRERREFLALIDAHGPALVAMLRRLCRNTHDAEDVFQETAMRVWRSFESRPKLWNPRGWLMKVAFHAFLDHSDHRKRSPQGKPQSPPVEPSDNRSASPESLAEHSEWSQRLNIAIEGLSPDIRQVIILHYTAGLTLSQTAEAMDVSLGTVKSRLNSALNKLRSVINELR